MDRSPSDGMNKAAFVTGGAKGLGRACALALASGGWRVAVGYRASDLEAKETLELVEAAGSKGVTVRLDVVDEQSVGEAFREASSAIGPILGLVNNAGYTKDGLALKYSMDTFDQTMATNVRGSYLCTQAALRTMLRAKWGRIVNMSSAVALRGNAGQTAYAASKTALVGVTKSLAREIGAKGITVNVICPGLVDTDMTSYLTEKAREVYVSQTPIGRTAHPQEIGAVVRFLMSEEASYVNGAVIPVDGGLTA